MFGLIKSSFVWQFAGGFMLGALGLVAVHAEQTRAAPAPVVQTAR